MPCRKDNATMKTNIITVANRKGGVAKTTTTLNLGAELIRRGYRVLYVDLDSQANLTYYLTTSRSAGSLLDLLANNRDINDFIVKISDSSSLLPADNTLSTADLVLNNSPVGKEYKLKEALEPIVSDYDFILIDTPPALDSLVVNALVSSKYVIIPTTTTYNSIKAINDLNAIIQATKKYSNRELEVLGVVVTRYSPRTNLAKQYRASIEDIAKAIDTTIFNTSIREANVVKEAEAMSKTVFEMKKSKAVEDYVALTDEVIERISKNERL